MSRTPSNNSARIFVPFFVVFSCTFSLLPGTVLAGDPPPEDAILASPAAVSAPVTSTSPNLPEGSTTGTSRLISGAGVRLRDKPSTSGKELARLTMGTEVTELERSSKEETVGGIAAPWVRIKTGDGREGWIFGGFCRPFDTTGRDTAFRSLIDGRLADENLAENDARELFAWLDRLAAAPSPLKAEYSLYRLLGLQKVLDGVSRREKNRLDDAKLAKDPQLGPLANELVYNEPGASWLVRADRFWALHDANRASPIAEKIAWAAAQQALPGETEGYGPAVLSWVWMTEGRYLKLYPKGENAVAVLKKVADTFSTFDPSWDPKTADQEELGTVRTQVADLRDAATATENGPERDAALAAIEAFRKRLP